jgi:glutathione S-transferase
MIKLYQFPPVWGIPNLSPFCIKVECALRMAGLDYETVPCSMPGKGPKGKLPFIEDGAMRLGDSELILDYLRDRYGFDPDRDLTAEQKAVSRAFQAMLDERFYWTNVYSRWCDERNWPAIREAIFGRLPAPVQSIAASRARKHIRRELHGHGMGRHAPEEIYAFGVADLRAVASYLGDKPYFHGEHPTRIDACLAGYLINLFKAPVTSPMREEGQRHPNLADHCERMLRTYFPESARSSA